MVWLGEPSMIHVEGQEAWPQVAESGDTWWRRVGTITPDPLPGLRRLTSMIDRLEVPSEAKKEKGAPCSIDGGTSSGERSLPA